MLRVALLVDGWNLLKTADRIKRRVNFGELPRAVVGPNESRDIVFQRFYIGPISGRNAPQRVVLPQLMRDNSGCLLHNRNPPTRFNTPCDDWTGSHSTGIFSPYSVDHTQGAWCFTRISLGSACYGSPFWSRDISGARLIHRSS